MGIFKVPAGMPFIKGTLSLADASHVGQRCFPAGDAVCTSGGLGYNMPCVCTDALLDAGYYYCDIENVVSCVDGCGSQTSCSQVGNCISGLQKCEGNKAYECVSGFWSLKANCNAYDPPATCSEQSGYYAYCEPSTWYYCMNNQDCIGSPSGWCCSKSSINVDGKCWNSQADCQNNQKVYCLNSQAGCSCTLRLGGCLAGERTFASYPDITVAKVNCENQVNISSECNKFCNPLSPGTTCDDKNECTTDSCNAIAGLNSFQCKNEVVACAWYNPLCRGLHPNCVIPLNDKEMQTAYIIVAVAAAALVLLFVFRKKITRLIK